MAVDDVVIIGGNYIGVWEEGPNYWKLKSSSKETVPIPLHHNGSYDDMVQSVIESGELEYEPNNVVIIYVMNEINVIPGSPTIPPPRPTIDEHDSFEDEILDAHPIDSEYHSMKLKDSIFSEEGGEKFDMMTTNNVESVNALLIAERDYPMASIFNSIAKRFLFSECPILEVLVNRYYLSILNHNNIDNPGRAINPDDEDLGDDELLNPRHAAEIATPANRRDRQVRFRHERRPVKPAFDDDDDLDGAGATGAIILPPLAPEAKFNITSTMI
ncbi:hypothetical protein CQW23_25749 [Capsicum baccatum]|uniref:Uncharacterized protein n=1 Tax=Capsicum baccatum TaxID=33114 RepID=A0A2G2VLV8_CAPBA|nr:hypothetical protein CQW23_25749 [Capsicum baccatum]